MKRNWFVGTLLGVIGFGGLAVGGVPQSLFNAQAQWVYTDCDIAAPQEQNIQNGLKNYKAKNADNSFRSLNANERASFKGCELVKRKSGIIGQYTSGQYRIEITDVQPIDGGVQLFAKAWKNGQPVGFGDGSVEIERFRVFNPPIMVPDGTKRTEVSPLGDQFQTDNFTENPVQAIRDDLAHTVSVVAKDGSNIVPGKVGNTTDTFAPSAGDGRTGIINQASWAAARGGTTGNATDYTGTTIMIDAENDSGGATWDVLRGFFPFDTSALPDTDTITSVTFSLVPDSNAGTKTAGIVLTTQASAAQVVNTDFDNLTLNSPVEATTARVDYTTTASYVDATFNATGIGFISKTGVTFLGVRHTNDIDNTTPALATRHYIIFRGGEYAGATSDPKLVVVHAGATSSNEQSHLMKFE